MYNCTFYVYRCTLLVKLYCIRILIDTFYRSRKSNIFRRKFSKSFFELINKLVVRSSFGFRFKTGDTRTSVTRRRAPPPAAVSSHSDSTCLRPLVKQHHATTTTPTTRINNDEIWKKKKKSIYSSTENQSHTTRKSTRKRSRRFPF